MFVEVETRRKPSRLTIGTLMFAGLSMLLAIWELRLPPDAQLDFLRAWGLVPERFWANWNDSWREWVRPVTALFVHADWLHLAGNLVFLWLFGLETERRIGAPRFLVLFIIGGAAANLIAAWQLAGSPSPIVGASGGVSAIIGAYLVLFPRARVGVLLPLGVYIQRVKVPALILIAFWFGFQLLYWYVGSNLVRVAWSAHIGGFILGCIMALGFNRTR